MTYEIEKYYTSPSYPFNSTIKFCEKLDYVYEFGVYGGKTMLDLLKQSFLENKPIKHFFGFDSFEGLPIDETEVIKEWKKGNFNAQQLFNDTPIGCAKRIQTLASLLFSSTQIIIETTLFENIQYKEIFKQADLVHVDCDLYQSTKVVLEFLYKNNLIKLGTVINYNDFPQTNIFDIGEGKAHHEWTQKYNIHCEQTHNQLFKIIKL